jgi:hypothetical protein
LLCSVTFILYLKLAICDTVVSDEYMAIKKKQACTLYRDVGRLIVSLGIGQYQLDIHRLDSQYFGPLFCC